MIAPVGSPDTVGDQTLLTVLGPFSHRSGVVSVIVGISIPPYDQTT